MFNQYTNPIAWDALNWKYYIVYTVWIAFEFAYMWLYCVETKGLTLEECAVLFDGADHQRQLKERVDHREEIDEKEGSKEGGAAA